MAAEKATVGAPPQELWGYLGKAKFQVALARLLWRGKVRNALGPRHVPSGLYLVAASGRWSSRTYPTSIGGLLSFSHGNFGGRPRAPADSRYLCKTRENSRGHSIMSGAPPPIYTADMDFPSVSARFCCLHHGEF